MKQNVGLGLRHTFHNYVLTHKPQVPWFEVITENYLNFGGAPRHFLTQIRQEYPLVFHGVSLSIGSLEPVRMNYLKELKKLISEFQPLWISDHLCWTFNGAENSHDLLPVPLTKESFRRISDKVAQVQDYLGQKIYLENPSAYVDFSCNEYLEQDFISELCQQSGCGLLLDLNNLIVNKYNLNYKPLEYLQAVKNCDVRQIHLAGHSVKEQVRIDTHDDEINVEALELLPVAKSYWPDVNPMIEWDDKIPPIEYLLSERERIQDIFNKAEYNSFNSEVENRSPDISRFAADNGRSMAKFWDLMKQNKPVSEDDVKTSEILRRDLPTPARVGMTVYNSAYMNRLLDVLQKDFPVLKQVLNDYFDDVMMDYLKSYPSIYDSIDFVGNQLSQFIKENDFSYDLGVDKRIIADLAAFENLSAQVFVATNEEYTPLRVSEFKEEDWVEKKIKLKNSIKVYEADCLMHPVVSAVSSGEAPEVPEIIKNYYKFYREDGVAYYKVINQSEYLLFKNFSEFKSFYSFVEDKESQFSEYAKILFENENCFCVE